MGISTRRVGSPSSESYISKRVAVRNTSSAEKGSLDELSSSNSMSLDAESDNLHGSFSNKKKEDNPQFDHLEEENSSFIPGAIEAVEAVEASIQDDGIDKTFKPSLSHVMTSIDVYDNNVEKIENTDEDGNEIKNSSKRLFS
jgi:hypothetical protein